MRIRYKFKNSFRQVFYENGQKNKQITSFFCVNYNTIKKEHVIESIEMTEATKYVQFMLIYSDSKRIIVIIIINYGTSTYIKKMFHMIIAIETGRYFEVQVINFFYVFFLCFV